MNIWAYKSFIAYQLKRKGIPVDDVDDIIQDVMEQCIKTGHDDVEDAREGSFIMLQIRSVLSEKARKFKSMKRTLNCLTYANVGTASPYSASNRILSVESDLREDQQPLMESGQFNYAYLLELVPKLSERVQWALMCGTKEAAIKYGVSRQMIEKDFKKFRLGVA